MKKNILSIIIAALIIAQVVSIVKISNLQSQIDSARAEISNLNNSTGSEISAIYANVYDEIKGSIETDYSLTGIVHNITIVGKFDAARAHMYLYADGALIAKKLRLY